MLLVSDNLPFLLPHEVLGHWSRKIVLGTLISDSLRSNSISLFDECTESVDVLLPYFLLIRLVLLLEVCGLLSIRELQGMLILESHPIISF